MRIKNKITWLTLFSIAMGFMETAVVIYLRKIYYPNGFQFPLVPIESNIALIEFLREAATIIMLLGIGILTGKMSSQKFAFFIYCFAIWDIFYYVFLKVFLNWPESFYTSDILFLIPVPWVGPVLAPCLVSISMVVFMLFIVVSEEKGINPTIRFKEWVLVVVGSIIVIFSFVLDYFKHVIKESTTSGIWTLSSKENLFNEIKTYVPSHYNWFIFWIGEALIIYTIIQYARRTNHSKTNRL
jgi:hypothetical protein